MVVKLLIRYELMQHSIGSHSLTLWSLDSVMLDPHMSVMKD